MKENKKASFWISRILVFTLAAGMLLNLIIPDRGFSSAENRPLASFPKTTLNGLVNGEAGIAMDRWYNDQFLFRPAYFHINYLFNKLVGEKIIQDVFLGKGRLIQNPPAPDDARVAKTGAMISQFAAASGMRTFFMAVPPAAAIQTDQLPAFAPVQDWQSGMDAIRQSVTEPVVSIDLLSVFQQVERPNLYYKTDHHWNSNGSWLGYTALAQAMNLPANEDDYQSMLVKKGFEGTLAKKTGSVFLSDTITIQPAINNPQYVVRYANQSKSTSIYQSSALDSASPYEVFLGPNQSIITITTDANTERTLLLFKDSYANCMIQYLLPYFSTITIIDPRYYSEDLYGLLQNTSFTDAAFIYSYATYVQDSSLSSVLSSYLEKVNPQALEQVMAALQSSQTGAQADVPAEDTEQQVTEAEETVLPEEQGAEQPAEESPQESVSESSEEASSPQDESGE